MHDAYAMWRAGRAGQGHTALARYENREAPRETLDLSAWASFCDELRDSLFCDHYFEVIDILPTFEANYLA
jgi:hypothetical protein